jgi:hypothetical protein
MYYALLPAYHQYYSLLGPSKAPIYCNGSTTATPMLIPIRIDGAERSVGSYACTSQLAPVGLVQARRHWCQPDRRPSGRPGPAGRRPLKSAAQAGNPAGRDRERELPCPYGARHGGHLPCAVTTQRPRPIRARATRPREYAATERLCKFGTANCRVHSSAACYLLPLHAG